MFIWLFEQKFVQVHLNFVWKNAIERLNNEIFLCLVAKAVAAPWFTMKQKHDNYKKCLFLSKSINVTILVKATKYICYVLLVFGYCCGANILKKKNQSPKPQETPGISRWGPHSPGFKFFGELQTLTPRSLGPCTYYLKTIGRQKQNFCAVRYTTVLPKLFGLWLSFENHQLFWH